MGIAAERAAAEAREVVHAENEEVDLDRAREGSRGTAGRCAEVGYLQKELEALVSRPGRRGVGRRGLRPRPGAPLDALREERVRGAGTPGGRGGG